MDFHCFLYVCWRVWCILMILWRFEYLFSVLQWCWTVLRGWAWMVESSINWCNGELLNWIRVVILGIPKTFRQAHNTYIYICICIYLERMLFYLIHWSIFLATHFFGVWKTKETQTVLTRGRWSGASSSQPKANRWTMMIMMNYNDLAATSVMFGRAAYLKIVLFQVS